MEYIQFKKNGKNINVVSNANSSTYELIKTNSITTIYVDANCKNGDGTVTNPFNNLQDAISAVKDGIETDIVICGDLHIYTTVNIPTGKVVNIIGVNGASIKGSIINTQHNRCCNNVAKIYVGDVCPQWIWVNGETRYPASTSRSNLYRANCSGYKDTSADTMTTYITIPVNDAVKLSNIDYTDTWITVLWMWMSYKCRISAIDTSNGKISCVQGIGSAGGNNLHTMSGSLRIILENAPIESCDMFGGNDLFQNGTYYVQGGYLYYKFNNNEDKFANIEIPVCETLISSEGTCNIYNLSVSQTNHIFDNTHYEGEHAGYSGRQSCARFNAAIEINGKSDIINCIFSHTTNHCIKLLNDAHDCNIVNNTFRDIGCSSIAIGFVPLTYKINIPSKCPTNVKFENNVVVSVGRIYSGACAISVFYGSNYKIRCNIVRDTYYTGITTGYTWSSAANPNNNGLIEYNILDLIGVGSQALYDGGAFYNLGNASGLKIENNIISNVYGQGDSSLRLDGIFIDESSANITIQKNLFYHCDKFYRFNVSTNSVYIKNNIFVDDFVSVSTNTSGSVTQNVFVFNTPPQSSSSIVKNAWSKINGSAISVTWDSNPTLGDPFFDSIGKDYRIKTQSIISAIDFDEFIPFVIGRWNNATIEHEYMEIIIEEITRNWNGELPK